MTLELEKAAGDPVMGIDEAGRGPLAGPVFAAAVHLPLALATQLVSGDWSAVNDSKKLTGRRRDALAAVIKSTHGCIWAVASATAAEIDRLNILRATHLAMKRAHDEVVRRLRREAGNADHPPSSTNYQPPTINYQLPTTNYQLPTTNYQLPTINYQLPTIHVLVDGLPVSTLPHAVNVVKGDAKSLLIAAASILAKTSRDAYCMEMDAKYPGYGFAQHKGYPTEAHFSALRALGPCPEHRRSFGPVSQLTLF